MRALQVLFISLGLSWSAFAQPGPPPSPSADLIPDHTAFRLFFAAIAGSSSPTPAEAARQNARLKPIQLTDVDKDLLVRAVSGFRNKLSNAQLAPQTTSFNAVVQGTLAELLGKMSPDGFQRLYAHVRLQKQYMMQVPFPPMTAHH
jgi:hypothetical protein